MILPKIVKWTLRLFGVMFIMIVVYLGSAFLLSSITVNSDFSPTHQNGIEIFLLTNGVHTDLVLPIRNHHKNWSEVIPFDHTSSKDSVMRYVAFGWGDRQFYIETPTWAELKFSTAVNALFFPSKAAMHVTFYKSVPQGEFCKKINISADQYMRLVRYVENSFQKNREDQYILIDNPGYGEDDCFYEANGSFHLFFTCNTWTNNELKISELKASLWTPFDKVLLDHY